MADDKGQGTEPPAGGAAMPSPVTRGDWVRAAAVGGTILSISGLHWIVDVRLFMWHNILHHLYLLPILYAALRFGWRGGLAASAVASVSYIPHVLDAYATQPFPGYLLSKSVALLEFLAASVVIGVLSEKDRRQRRKLEETTRDLSRVYNELQGSIERMKRSERLYAIGQLAAGLAHEIRNPIAGIAGAVGILQRNPDSEQRRQECLRIAAKECDRLNRLLTSFLGFAKPRPPAFQTARVESLMDSVMELAVHAIGSQPVAVRQQIAPDLPPVECDVEQIKQVLLNLVINAIQAMPQGGEITLSADVRDGALVIGVQDQGSGVRPEDLGKVFDPFFTTKETGTGLGLPVAHQIVAQHGGAIWFDPNPDGGMTFCFRLPLRLQGTA